MRFQHKSRMYSRAYTLLCILLLFTLSLGAADYIIDDSVTVRQNTSLPAHLFYTITANDPALPASTSSSTTYTADFLGIIPLKKIHVQKIEDVRLYPGGMPFGAKVFTDGLVVVGFSDIDCESGSVQPAYDAGIRENDVILKINGSPVSSSENVGDCVANSHGNALVFTVRRGNQEMEFEVFPSLSRTENRYKTGMWIRDNTAGIGTVTFLDPESGSFGGLGHGITDPETGVLLPMSRGMIVHVAITDVKRGVVGIPGELRGTFSPQKMGVLLQNLECGVFGILTEIPADIRNTAPLSIALKEEIQDGKATILCTLDETGIHSYEVEIRKIKNALDHKNLEITVTDPSLLQLTGGIVQGMSGSPILQNGKLIGAVTHVLVNNPTKGYGIFIENMLNATK